MSPCWLASSHSSDKSLGDSIQLAGLESDACFWSTQSTWGGTMLGQSGCYSHCTAFFENSWKGVSKRALNMTICPWTLEGILDVFNLYIRAYVASPLICLSFCLQICWGKCIPTSFPFPSHTHKYLKGCFWISINNKASGSDWCDRKETELND